MALDELTEGDDFDELLSIVSDNSDDTLSAFKIVEQAPLDQQVIDERVLDSVTSSIESTPVSVHGKKTVTVCIVTNSATSGNGANLQLLASPTSDNDDFGNVGFVDIEGTLNSSKTIDENKTQWFEVVNAAYAKRLKVDLDVTDGTHTVYIFGGVF